MTMPYDNCIDRLEAVVRSGPLSPREAELVDIAFALAALYTREGRRYTRLAYMAGRLSRLAGPDQQEEASLISAHLQEQFEAEFQDDHGRLPGELPPPPPPK